MISRREQIVQELMTRLALIPFFRSVRRGDRAALEVVDLPAALVHERGDSAVDRGPSLRTISLGVHVDVVVRGTDAGDALSQLAEARANVLSAIAEPTLDGLASTVSYEGSGDPEWADVPGQPPEVALRMALAIEYEESREDPWA